MTIGKLECGVLQMSCHNPHKNAHVGGIMSDGWLRLQKKHENRDEEKRTTSRLQTWKRPALGALKGGSDAEMRRCEDLNSKQRERERERERGLRHSQISTSSRALADHGDGGPSKHKRSLDSRNCLHASFRSSALFRMSTPSPNPIILFLPQPHRAATGSLSRWRFSMRSTRSPRNDSMTSVIMLMVSLFACSYIAGRLWQDAEIRSQLISMDPSVRYQAKDPISVDDTLRLIDCKEQQKKLANAELELTAAKSQGYKSINKTFLEGRRTVVVGIFTSFSGRSRRTSSRKTWIPTGAAMKELESDKGIIIRYVIGRSSNRGDMLDKQIDQENNETEDFLILEDHVESEDNLTQKSRLFFSKAVNTWDADFYVKMDDNVGLNIDMMGSMLSSHRDKPRAYVGCMKSGTVINDPNAQWYESDWWKFGESKSEYHRHAAGQVYGLSRSLAMYISINSAYLKEYKNEDVAVGAWMLALDTEHIDDRNLCCSPDTGAVCWLQ